MGSARHLLVLGATGRTGTRICGEALVAGHRVRGFGRSASARTLPSGVEPFAGDVLDEQRLAEALVGVDAVVTALSIPRTSTNPFAPLVGQPDLHSRSTTALIAAMERAGVQRLVKLSAQGVGDSARRTGWGFRALIAVSTLRHAFGDHAVADQLVADSALRWTVVRPPRLNEGPAHPVEAGPELTTGTLTSVSRDAVAQFVVGALDDPQTEGQVLTLRPA